MCSTCWRNGCIWKSRSSTCSFAVQIQRQDGCVERFVAQCVIQCVVIELDRHGRVRRRRRRCPGRVRCDADGGSHPFLALRVLLLRFRYAILLLHFSCESRSATRRLRGCAMTNMAIATTFYSMNSELTDSSLLMRRMVSAISSATRQAGGCGCSACFFAQRDGVGHHQFVERRLLDALDRPGRTAPGAYSRRSRARRPFPSAHWPLRTACWRYPPCRP